MRTAQFFRPSVLRAVSGLLVVLGLVRIVLSYTHTGQAFDEPSHVAAGIEFLDKGTYLLDPVHPTLARIAIALPLYLAGERYPFLPAADPESHNYNVVGNHILYDSGHLLRNLILARLGLLPFFILGAFVVHLWTKELGGDLAAAIAVLFYTTTPAILAFSSIAYTDMVAASTQLAAMFTFYRWLQRPDLHRTIWFGVTLGMALLAKLTTVLFVPAAAAGMFAVWYFRERSQPSRNRFATPRLLAAVALAVVIVWAGYRFSMRPLQEATGITVTSMPSFQRFPHALRGTAQDVVLWNPRLPAPELLHGVALAYALNRTGSESYLLGHIKSGGWWYFYLVALGVKLPLPLLLAFAIGVIATLKYKETSSVFPLISLAGVLLITLRVSYQVGTRHILVVVPLIAIISAIGIGAVLHRTTRRAVVLAVIALLTWQAIESASAQSDFLAYFNQLSGKDPSSVLVTGCDLDCGQDLFRLARELRARNTPECALLVWSSADITRSGLPVDEEESSNAPENPAPLHGCVALSSRAFRLGDVMHHSYGAGYFSWLSNYQPLANVGRTIRLYDIPQQFGTKDKGNVPSSSPVSSGKGFDADQKLADVK